MKIEKEEEQKKSKSGTPPVYSINVPVRLRDAVNLFRGKLLEKVKEFDIKSHSQLYYHMVLKGEVVDGKLVVDLTEIDYK
jgi:hypothetical protein